MRRFVTVLALLFFTIPFGISITGCSKKTDLVYCNGGSTGATAGQVVTITLQPKIYGISLNQAEQGQTSTPSATDCKGSSVSVTGYAYGTTDMSLVDVQPSTGRLCGGTWNKNTGGGIPDYTTCNSTGKTGMAYITATSNGTVSNPLPVYVHPVVTSVVLGTPSADCTTDPATNCSPASINSALADSAIAGCPTSATVTSNPLIPSTGCCTHPPGDVLASTITPVTPYLANGCLSQGVTGQLSARVYAGGGTTQNVSCQVGHLTYAAQTAAVVTIDQNGVATAQKPGATIIDATVALAGSSAGFFSTCPPTDIALSYPGSATGTTNIIVNQNNTQPITATVTDKNGTSLTGLSLEYVSTTPITIPASSNGTVTPVFPGEASITAICQPPTCNTAPQSLLGVFGNGKSVTSKSVSITTPGTNSTNLYIASTDSQYLVPVDFTQTQLGAPVRLPYVPNSMIISNDGTSIYMGSDTELMVISAASGAITKQDVSVPGKVLAVSPNSSTIVISDTSRGQIHLYTSGGAVASTYGGVGTQAAFSPDSQTVYIAAGNQILVYSLFSGWKSISPATASGGAVTDVTVTQPAVGAYFAGATTTARGYCPATTTTSASNPPSVSNVFYPLADTAAVATDRITATNDGVHILGANAATGAAIAAISDIQVNLAPVSAGTVTSPNASGSSSASGGIVCPSSGTGITFSSSTYSTPLAGITPSAITGVLPTSDSRVAFITYSTVGTTGGGLLPYYLPPVAGPPTAQNYGTVQLSAGAVAPVGGAISADNSTIYVGTSGDGLVHIISTASLTDTKTIAPNLPSASGGAGAIAVPNLLVEKPRKTT